MQDYLEQMQGTDTLWGKIGGVSVLVRYKNVKRLSLRLKADTPWLIVTAPRSASGRAIMKFVRENGEWIEKTRSRLSRAPRVLLHQYVNGEIFYLWGKPLTLSVKIAPESAYGKNLRLRGSVWRENNTLCMELSREAEAEERAEILEAWYKRELEAALPQIFASCAKVVGKRQSEWHTRKMSSRWGSCNTLNGRICINTNLARLEPKFLAYVVTHELTHLWERGHGAAFQARMDKYCPDWRELRKKLKDCAAMI